MGKFFIAFYVVTTLLLSGFAKADQIGFDAQLDEVSFQKSTLDFLVTGRSADACTTQVMIAEQRGDKGDEIQFKVLETVSLAELCIQKVTFFTKRIPTRELIFVSRIKIDPDQVYTLSVANSSATVQVLGSELL